MSKAIDTVWQTAEAFMKDPKFVTMGDIGQIEYLARTEIKVKAPSINKKERWVNIPQDIRFKCVLKPLMLNAINYQYWYGCSYVRPNGSCASKAIKMLNEIFEMYDVSSAVDVFIERLSQERYPNLANRITHLRELEKDDYHFCRIIADAVNMGSEDMWVMDTLITQYPGYADDIFLKRASLFFMDLYRAYGWFGKCISEFPVPADYQVPKVLNGMGLLFYANELQEKINDHELIPAGSLMECEIRSGTLLVCRDLAKKSDITMCDLDDILWGMRDEYKNPFHLTVTTWY